MTEEDMKAKERNKMDLVAQREELDQMYEESKTSAGPEFTIYLKLKRLAEGSGE